MISKEYIDKFTKILSYYEISQSDIYDITRAISFAESFGTHPIRLKDLAVSGVDYFANITSDRKDAKPLPDTRLMRVMCDSVTVILFIKKSNIFAKPDVMSVMGMLSNNLSTVLTQANKLMKPDFRGRLNLGKIDHYKTVEECEKVLNTFIKIIEKSNDSVTGDIKKFVDFIENYCSVKLDFSGLVIDNDYKEAFDGVYFASNIIFKDKKENVLDSITTYLIDNLLKSKDRLRESLLISTKTRSLGLSKKPILKITPEKYKNIRADSFILNALNGAFTFTHASSIQNIDSLIVLYALINLRVDEMSTVKEYLGGSNK